MPDELEDDQVRFQQTPEQIREHELTNAYMRGRRDEADAQAIIPTDPALKQVWNDVCGDPELFDKCLVRAVELYLDELTNPDKANIAKPSDWASELPPLTSRLNIRLYISAVTHGVSIGIINGPTARVMLYSAQLALSSLRAQVAAKRGPGRPRKEVPID